MFGVLLTINYDWYNVEKPTKDQKIKKKIKSDQCCT